VTQQVEELRSRLAPPVQALLAFVDSFTPEGDMALPQVRQVLLERDNDFFRQHGVARVEVGSVDERLIAVAGGEITIRFYKPHGDEGARPAFLHLHGGGFVFGSIDQLFYDFKCREICHACACVVASVGYRLAPEHTFPTAPEDCFAALQYVAKHALELGIDAERIAVGGDSAGGNLAAAVALMTRDRGGPKLVLQVLEIPVTDNAQPESYRSWQQFGKGYGLEDDLVDLVNENYFTDIREARHPYASPLLAQDLSGLAPAHVMTAEFDILRDSGEAYSRRLQDAGVRTTVRRHADHVHGSAILYRTWQPARMWMDEIIRELNAAFAQG
jgi:acetyl esterase